MKKSNLTSKAYEIPLSYSEFQSRFNLNLDLLSRRIYHTYGKSIKIKKEELAIKNLVLILGSVLKISHKKGFHAMSLRDLSSETELSMGALCSYFSGKDELVKMLFHEGQILFEETISIACSGSSSQTETLKKFICAHLYLTEDLHKIFYFFYMETKSLKSSDQRLALAMEQTSEKFLEDILLRGKSNGEFQIVNTILTTSIIKAMLQDWYIKKYKYSKRKIHVEEYAQFLIDHILKTIKK